MFAGSRLLLPVLRTLLHWCRNPGGRRDMLSEEALAAEGDRGAEEVGQHGEAETASGCPRRWCWNDGRRRREPANIQHKFNKQINKHKSKAAAPHRRLPHTKQTKIQAWSSLVFHCRRSSFYPSGAPPWDSRPVSGAGVDHYH